VKLFFPNERLSAIYIDFPILESTLTLHDLGLKFFNDKTGSFIVTFD